MRRELGGSPLEFLKELGVEERFFLFLHTYAVHDPYDPGERYASLYWSQPPPGTFAPTGPNLVRCNRGELDLDRDALDYYVSLYDGGIRYADEILREFYAGLEELGIADEAAIVITSDHGEEFLEHGRMVHDQIYRETLHVPLLIVHPRLEGGRRVRSIVESIDIAPTLYELGGVAGPTATSGRSLVPALVDPKAAIREEAYAEAFVTPSRSLIRWSGERLYQLILREPVAGPDGTWVERSVSFDAPPGQTRIQLQLVSYHEPRTVEIFSGGELRGSIEVGTAWTTAEIAVPFPDGDPTVTLSSRGCVSPSELGVSEDRRCLSFKVRGVPLVTARLYDLTADPAASRDLSRSEPELLRTFTRRLRSYEWRARAPVRTETLPEDVRRRLESLGYLR